jgi:hypothetical protein
MNTLRIILSFLCMLSLVVAAEDVKMELTDGQYQVSGTAYRAIVPPTGLLSYLEIGKKVFMSDAFIVNNGKDWNVPSKNICASISRTESGGLACDGKYAKLIYSFSQDSIELSISAKAEPIKFFINLTEKSEGVITDSRDKGRQVAVGGERGGAYGLNEAQVYIGGQLLSVTGMDSLYGQNILRLDIPEGATRKVYLKMRVATAEDKSAFSIPPVYSEALTVISPLDWQVFQRRTLTDGNIRIAGKSKTTCDSVQFRLAKEEWRTVPIDSVTGNFSAQFPAPAGGWYRCELRTMKDGKEISSKVIEHVGVGEVFVGAGQSNSTNCGEEPQKPKSGMVSTFSGTSWRMADDPQPGVHDASDKGSFWPAFGDAMYARLKVPIGFAVTGQGGSRVEQWQPGGELFNWTLSRIMQLGPQGFRTVLWHQGESDGATPPEEYARRMQSIIEQSNARAGWSFPWMVARVCNTKGQDLLIKQGIAIEGPYTDPLKGEYRGRNGADVHFSAKGLQKHGELWAEKIGEYLGNEKK